jgi:hypothetical protein
MHDEFYHKTSFPIVLTYVMMGHKSQGAIIATIVIIDIKKKFTHDLTYVMFSRVTN